MLELKKTPEHTIDRVFLLALLASFCRHCIFSCLHRSKTIPFDCRQHDRKLWDPYRILLSGRKNESKWCGGFCRSHIHRCLSCHRLIWDCEWHDLHNLYLLLRRISPRDHSFRWNNCLPGDGQKIIETKALAIDMVSSNLYCFTITDTTGYTYPLYISLNAKQS